MARRTSRAARARTSGPSPSAGGDSPTLAPIWRGPALIIALLLVVAVCAVYWSLPTHSYVNYDDNLHVYENKRLSPASPENVMHFWTNPFSHRGEDGLKPYEQLYAPVTFTVYAALAGIARLPQKVSPPGMGSWDLDPGPYHVAGLVLHVLNTLLVFFLLRRLVRNDWAAAAGAAFFGLHPVQVEPVAWVSAMNNELVDLFGFLALILYLNYAEGMRDGQSPAQTRVPYVLALACIVLALLSKPSAVVLVAMAAVLDAAVIRRPLVAVAKSLWPWAVLTVGCLLVNQGLQPPTVKVDHNMDVPVSFRPIIAGDALAFYLGKIVWPGHLGFDYGRHPAYVYGLRDIPYLRSLLTVLFAVLLLAIRRRAPMLTVAGALFLIALSPVIGLVTYYFQATSTVADRYLYLALFGPALAVAWLLSRVPGKFGYPAGAVCLAVLALLGMKTADQTKHWRDSEALYKQAIAVNPTSFTAHDNYGIMLAEQKRLPEAITVLRQTAAIAPQDPGCHDDLAHALSDEGFAKGQAGDTAGAIAEFREAIRVKPDFELAHERLGLALSMQGNWDASVTELREAIRLKPNNASPHYILGVALSRLRQMPGARQELQEALRLQPGYPEAEAAMRTLHL